MRFKKYIVLALVCLFYWVLDSIWSVLSFEYNLKKLMFSEPGSYLDTLLLKVPPYQVVSRLMVVVLFVIFGSMIIEFFIKRQTAERQRQEVHDTLMTVLNSIDATIYAADLNTREILFMNQYMIDRFGGDWTGRICHEAFRGSADACPHCNNENLVDKEGRPTGVIVWEGWNPVVKAWYVNYDRAVKWYDGRMVKLQIATDITQFKDLQKRQANAEEQLRQAQKMEAVGTLAGGIAHDFNNLLQAINGFAQLLLMDKSEQDPDWQGLTAIHKAGKRASDLVRSLLLFSRKAGIQQKPLELNLEIERARKVLERIIPKMVDIEIHPGGHLWRLMADPVQIEQIILNLGTNAADAMPDGGVLSFETSNLTLDSDYADRRIDAEPGRYVLLTVSDTGKGMDEETIEHIFEPFYTTKEIGKGTGLGLASVYGIVKSHGGRISCYSEIGQGASFKIYFPAMDLLENEVEEEDAEAPKPLKGGSETILLVDDEEAIIGSAGQALKRYGYTVMTASNGEEALEVYSANSGAIDLVIMDLGMPGMGGHKCLRELLQIDAAARVMIASGYSINGQVKKTLEAGAVGYVGKPYQLADLLRKVREALDGQGEG